MAGILGASMASDTSPPRNYVSYTGGNAEVRILVVALGMAQVAFGIHFRTASVHVVFAATRTQKGATFRRNQRREVSVAGSSLTAIIVSLKGFRIRTREGWQGHTQPE
jgi:hypothetical protein